MTSHTLKTPVALIIFNRPETTKQVLAKIAEAKPRKLLVVADAPRANHEFEANRCREARAIIETISWDCEVLTNYADLNMGCRSRVASGLDWVFSEVDEAIILEDDCLPHPSFFRFCEELLTRYRSDERIAQIGGVNFQFGRNRTPYSYYFSRYPHIWGWATWRRSWQYYDVAMRDWPRRRDEKWLHSLTNNKREEQYWMGKFEAAYSGQINTWDYQWTYSCWLRNALTILPNTNLISNIGFGEGATHTRRRSLYASMPMGEMQIPIIHPSEIARNESADHYTSRTMFNSSFSAKARNLISSYLGRPL